MESLYNTIIDSKIINLIDILNCIKTNINKYHFSVFEFDGLLSKKTRFDINSISYNAVKNENGYQISAEDLYELAKDIKQVYDIILVGNIKGVKGFDNSYEWKSKNDVVIEMIDCGPWEVLSTSNELIRKVGKMAVV